MEIEKKTFEKYAIFALICATHEAHGEERQKTTQFKFLLSEMLQTPQKVANGLVVSKLLKFKERNMLVDHHNVSLQELQQC